MSPEFAAALCAAQAAGLVAVKDQTADLGERAGKYSYADLVAVWSAIRDILKDNGIAVLQPVGKMRSESATLVFSVRTILVHRSGDTVDETGEFPCPPMGARNFSQAFGSALTYARRYALCAALGVATGDDDDAARARRNDAAPDRDSPPQASDSAPWAKLMDGRWCDVASPDGSGPLCDAKSKKTLWQKYPDHAGLTAWAADIVTYDLSQLGFSWEQFAKEAGGEWPVSFEACDPAQVRQAANSAKALTAKYEKAS